MKNVFPHFLFLLLFFIWAEGLNAQEFPNAQISNHSIQAKLFLPESEIGYYRASRFDWSGLIYALEFKGHSYFGQWFEKYDPYLHEAVMGPMEAFDPLGYVGDEKTFTKIGIGILERIDTLPYHFSKPYPIVDHGVWNVETSENQIEFSHQLSKGSFPYQYKKTIRLVEDKLIMDHVLINDGEFPIETEVFNHNFFVIDDQTIGPGYVVQVPFQIEGDTSALGDFAEVRGNEVHYLKQLQGSDRARIRQMSGFNNSSDDYQITIENRDSRAGVKITSDRPISKMILWSEPRAICPEPYILVKVFPSESFTWSIIYEFYTL